MKSIKTKNIVIATFSIILVGCSGEDPSNYKISNSSYFDLERTVGCQSSYSNDKKEDIFEQNYDNRWMTWGGRVSFANRGEVAINVDYDGLPDLIVDFEDGETGYNLREGQTLTVKFVLWSLGGCYLPYRGRHAVLLS